MSSKHSLNVPARAGAIFTTAELKAAGNTDWHLSAKRLPRVSHGHVPVPGFDPEDFYVRAESARLLMRPGRFFSRATAARFLGLPATRTLPLIEVGAIRPVHPPDRRGILGHCVERNRVHQVPSAPDWLPTPAETWGLLAGTTKLENLVMVGDYLISGASRYDEPICTRAELEATSKRCTGFAGVKMLRQALPLLRTGVESPAESHLRMLLWRSNFPEPQTMCPVDVGDRVLYADLGYPEWRIAIEYEGAYHFGNEEQAKRDLERAEQMRDAGWIVLRVTSHDLQEPQNFLARLYRAIAKAQAGRK